VSKSLEQATGGKLITLRAETISDLIELAFVLMKCKSKIKENVGYKCALTKVQVEWLAANAFRVVLHKRQSKFGKVLEWLDGRIAALREKKVSLDKGVAQAAGVPSSN